MLWKREDCGTMLCDAQGSEAQYEGLDELNVCLVIEHSEIWVL